MIVRFRGASPARCCIGSAMNRQDPLVSLDARKAGFANNSGAFADDRPLRVVTHFAEQLLRRGIAQIDSHQGLHGWSVHLRTWASRRRPRSG